MNTVKTKSEFDQFADSYEQLLKDPIRDRFSPNGTLFFHVRKRDVIREHFRRRGIDTRTLSYLDVGCGKGELAGLLRDDFGVVAGCDPSQGMLEAASANGIEIRVQEQHEHIPFEDRRFDFLTAVCVYHHVPLAARKALLTEMRRVVKPGGTISIIEHNPFNPATRLIVSRTPVDADAILLRPSETRHLFRGCGLEVEEVTYFLYFPESAYQKLHWMESALGRIPFGGQYAAFARVV